MGLVACGSTDSENDSGSDPSPCEGGGEASLEVGFGTGGEFWTFDEGASVGLAPAPQGGYGVWVRAKTTGLRSMEGETPHATSAVLLETYIDDELAGSFLNETVEVYCQDDGTGLLWDVAVGFDPVEYATNDDLIGLDGQAVRLYVEATDREGRVASGSVDVVIDVGK